MCLPSTHTRLVAAAVVFVWLSPSLALAQAWLPQRHEGSVSLLFQHLFVTDHLLGDGSPIDVGHITTDNLLVDVTYGLSSKLAVSLGVPYTASIYRGTRPHPSVLDNHAYHGTFQDIRFDVRYNVTRRGIVISPFVGVLAPSHSYEYFAHAAPGRRLWEVQLGAFAGHAFDRVPGLFVQGRYSYGFVERLFDIRHDRSNTDLELGYFVTPSVRVFGLATGQVTHGGIDVPRLWSVELPPALRPHHDRLARANFLDLGGGSQWSLSRTLDVYVSVLTTVRGENVHALKYGITFGTTYSFGERPMLLASRDTPTRRLVKCLCQKK
jgi:hypothetical protein